MVAKDRRIKDVSRTDGQDINIDGAVRDQDLFVLGDSDDDEDALESEVKNPDNSNSDSSQQSTPAPQLPIDSIEARAPSPPVGPHKYQLKRGDTLLGIAFRFKIDVRTTCIENCFISERLAGL